MSSIPWKYRLVPPVFSLAPGLLSRSLSPSGLVLPYYHMISDASVPHTDNLYDHKNSAQFRSDIDFLLKNFRPVGLTEVIEAVRSGRPFSDPSFHVTFDDGFREMAQVVAPLLREAGVPATFFVNSAYTDNRKLCHEQKRSLLAGRVRESVSPVARSAVLQVLKEAGIHGPDIASGLLSLDFQHIDFLDRVADVLEVDFQKYLEEEKPYLESSQIRRMLSEGFTFGAHSVDHPRYNRIDMDEQYHQTVASTRWLKREFGLAYGAFAFPYSDDHIREDLLVKVADTGEMQVLFGTGGDIDVSLGFCMKRFSLEKPILPARRIFDIQYARKIRRRVASGR